MINPHEIFILIVSTGVLASILFLRGRLAMIPSWKWLVASFLLYYLSTVLTVAEGFVWPELLNFLEHLLRALFLVPVIFWLRSLRPLEGNRGRPS